MSYHVIPCHTMSYRYYSITSLHLLGIPLDHYQGSLPKNPQHPEVTDDHILESEERELRLAGLAEPWS